MRIPIINTVTLRACDLPDSATIKVDGRWRHLYDATRGGEAHQAFDEDITRIAKDELDDRYVVLRVSDDPSVVVSRIGVGADAKDHAVDAAKHVDACRPAGMAGVRWPPAVNLDYEDRLVIAQAHDLYEMQVVAYQDVDIEYLATARQAPGAGS